ncbi:MAG: hypothetical protein Q7S87_00345 [Agitococcus sp.]|nr:hypothetical protein [Agitococcus sp.]
MSSHPKMTSLPAVVDCAEWDWKPADSMNGFWIGTDKQGNRWLTKLRGSFCAYREIVFARIAQELGWSIQSSSFICLDSRSAKMLGRAESEVHAVHWYMKEHQAMPCSLGCPLVPLRNGIPTNRFIEKLSSSQIGNIRDLLRCEIAIYIFGALEPCGYFYTPEHDFVIIDSELVFSSGPRPINESPLLKNSDGTISDESVILALEVCAQVSALSEDMVSRIIAIPNEIHIDENWSISDIVRKGIESAKDYLRSQT